MSSLDPIYTSTHNARQLYAMVGPIDVEDFKRRLAWINVIMNPNSKMDDPTLLEGVSSNPNAKPEQPRTIIDEKKSDDLETRVYRIVMDDPNCEYYSGRIINEGKALKMRSKFRKAFQGYTMLISTILHAEGDEVAITNFHISDDCLTFSVSVSFQRCPQTQRGKLVNMTFSQLYQSK